jgi:hypothetical protein
MELGTAVDSRQQKATANEPQQKATAKGDNR